ncbi:MAG: hypothetical protein AAGD25_02905 [Cyanobacteria bacterium P01_F01_bin.150]
MLLIVSRAIAPFPLHSMRSPFPTQSVGVSLTERKSLLYNSAQIDRAPKSRMVRSRLRDAIATRENQSRRVDWRSRNPPIPHPEK